MLCWYLLRCLSVRLSVVCGSIVCCRKFEICSNDLVENLHYCTSMREAYRDGSNSSCTFLSLKINYFEGIHQMGVQIRREGGGVELRQREGGIEERGREGEEGHLSRE